MLPVKERRAGTADAEADTFLCPAPSDAEEAAVAVTEVWLRLLSLPPLALPPPLPLLLLLLACKWLSLRPTLLPKSCISLEARLLGQAAWAWAWLAWAWRGCACAWHGTRAQHNSPTNTSSTIRAAAHGLEPRKCSRRGASVAIGFLRSDVVA